MSDRRIRRSQTLSPFGVGAIFDIVGESFVAEDTQRWKGKATNVDAPRIAAIMGVNGLRTAPPAPERGSKGAGVPFYRFPQWMFCPAKNCRRMTRWSLTKERGIQSGDPPRCTECDTAPPVGTDEVRDNLRQWSPRRCGLVRMGAQQPKGSVEADLCCAGPPRVHRVSRSGQRP